MLRPAPLALFSARGGGSKRSWKTDRVGQLCRAGVGQEAATTLQPIQRPPQCWGAVRGAARAAALGCHPWHWGMNPEHPPCSCLRLSEHDHRFKGSGAASPPRGASRLYGDRAREVEATDKAWEGRRKDQSQPAELQGLKIATAPAWHCCRKELSSSPLCKHLGFFPVQPAGRFGGVRESPTVILHVQVSQRHWDCYRELNDKV